jgi:hypothetical protein
MADEEQEAKRLVDFRILALEREQDAQELRLRAVESAIVKVNGSLDMIPEIRSGLRQLFNDRYKNLIGFVLVMATVIGTFLFNHLTSFGAK